MEQCGVKGLAQGPTALQILSWPHLGSNHQPCGSKSSSSSLTTTLQAARNRLPATGTPLNGNGIP